MKKIDFIFLQTGVGSWAASIISYILNNWDYAPSFISVEPFSANCLFESIKAGKRVKVNNNQSTCMAGLDCGTVSKLAWQILKNSISASISISDNLFSNISVAIKCITFHRFPLILVLRNATRS